MVARSITSSIGRRAKDPNEDAEDITPEDWQKLQAETEQIQFDNPLQNFIAEFRQGKASPFKLARKLHLTTLITPAHAEKEGSLMFFPTEYASINSSLTIHELTCCAELSFPTTNCRKLNYNFVSLVPLQPLMGRLVSHS